MGVNGGSVTLPTTTSAGSTIGGTPNIIPPTIASQQLQPNLVGIGLTGVQATTASAAAPNTILGSSNLSSSNPLLANSMASQQPLHFGTNTLCKQGNDM